MSTAARTDETMNLARGATEFCGIGSSTLFRERTKALRYIESSTLHLNIVGLTPAMFIVGLENASTLGQHTWPSISCMVVVAYEVGPVAR